MMQAIAEWNDMIHFGPQLPVRAPIRSDGLAAAKVTDVLVALQDCGAIDLDAGRAPPLDGLGPLFAAAQFGPERLALVAAKRSTPMSRPCRSFKTRLASGEKYFAAELTIAGLIVA
jgi:hypothetical protein